MTAQHQPEGIPIQMCIRDRIKARAGETLLETAISLQKAGLHTPAQQAIHLALPVVESKNLAFSMVCLLYTSRCV